jgi:predicted enzyme related to lactoylglutathione lyase
MTSGAKTILFPVTDLTAAKAVYTALLGVEPAHDAAYYVGYEVAGQHIGLVPDGGRGGLTGPTVHWHVDDIAAALEGVLKAGATELSPAKDVGGGRLVATVKDADGNVVGLLQDWTGATPE